MAMQEQLDKFKKQQEKCQRTLTSITASNKAQLANARAPALAVKFSKDTERLQHINSIRKAPVGAQIKRVIDLLQERRQVLTPEQINEACYVNLKSNKDVFDSLRNNPKVNYDGKGLSYKSKHDVKDGNQLIRLIRNFPDGIAIGDLMDAYPNVKEDLQALKAAGKIWILSNSDCKLDIAYPNDDAKVSIKVDDDLKRLFREIELPQDMSEIEMYLQKNGHKPVTNTERRRAMAEVQGMSSKPKPKKNKEISKRTKLTNSHLPELFRTGNGS